jgi:hypothetical protein
LYFSCKNYQETLWTCFTKVVLFFTRNPTNLGLHFSDFSMILYEFYKIQPKAKNYSRISLHRCP